MESGKHMRRRRRRRGRAGGRAVTVSQTLTLPQPGGPHRMSEGSVSLPSSGVYVARASFCPMNSERQRGRIRSASGALAAFRATLAGRRSSTRGPSRCGGGCPGASRSRLSPARPTLGGLPAGALVFAAAREAPAKARSKADIGGGGSAAAAVAASACLVSELRHVLRWSLMRVDATWCEQTGHDTNEDMRRLGSL